MQSTGYDNSLNIANLTITLFAPTNDAFSAPVLQVKCGLAGCDWLYQTSCSYGSRVKHDILLIRMYGLIVHCQALQNDESA